MATAGTSKSKAIQKADRWAHATPYSTGDQLTFADMARKAGDNGGQRLDALVLQELPLWSEGCVVAGLDEVGAGPIAGPVTAACVVLDPARIDDLKGVDDSKALTPRQRTDRAEAIRSSAKAWAVAEASVAEIDRINILQAALLAMSRALEDVVEQLDEVHHLLVDAREVPGTDIPQTPLIKGDSRSLSIAAASILAKVDRDAYMVRMAETYPEYGFERHKGYGTAAHLAALRQHGATPLHRRSFQPVSTVMTQGSLF